MPQETLAELNEDELKSYLLDDDISHLELIEYALENDIELSLNENTSSLEDEIIDMDISITDMEDYL